ncbi:shikimate kinase [Moheibacter stercoris]|uniref:Shikimate kinase n=1 Tax=Moheibacter stercoris TaxID=1628251 RepID=A0ABV2LTY6_9FLAO
MKISLVGYMGSGKSTIGELLAKTLGIYFIDLDKQIEHKTNQSISDTLKALGEIRFRKLEKATLEEVLSLEDSYVLSLGGGTPVYYDNMNQINLHTHSVYLRMTPMELRNRLVHEKENRPLIARIPDDELPEFIAKHLFERSNFYNQAKSIVDVKSKSVDELVEEIRLLLPHP